MRNAISPPIVEAASEAQFPQRLTFDDFLGKLPARDKANVQKRIAAAVDAPPDGGLLAMWQRLASALHTLAPHAAKTVGRQAVQFFIADGKYRMQAFALEDLQEGCLAVYCPDVLSEALAAGTLLAPAACNPADQFGVPGQPDPLFITALDRSTIDPPIYYKDMVGWNRRALRITLPTGSAARQVEAAESVCLLASKRFSPRPAAAAS